MEDKNISKSQKEIINQPINEIKNKIQDIINQEVHKHKQGKEFFDEKIQQLNEKEQILQSKLSITVKKDNYEDKKQLPLDGDYIVGSQIYSRNCLGCHSLNAKAQGKFLEAPLLGLIFGRQAGSCQEFTNYSLGLVKKRFHWTSKNLYKFMENPQELIPGNKCGLKPHQIPSEEERSDLVAFLKTHSQELEKYIYRKQSVLRGGQEFEDMNKEVELELEKIKRQQRKKS